MEHTTEEKQAYLREEILNQYDPEQFINFLRNELKVPDLDPDRLTMKQLSTGVLKFKQYKYYQELQQPARKLVVKAKRTVDLGKGVKEEEFETRWEVRTLQPRKQLKVSVPKHEKIEKDKFFFSSTEIWFIIESSLGGTVKRKQQDFEWLSQTILRIFPNHAIPQLPSIRRDNQQDYDKRASQFEQYLISISKWPQVISSKILEDFLSETGAAWQSAQKNHDKAQFVKGVRQIKTESGWVKADLTNRTRSFVINTADYQSKIQRLYEKLGEGVSRVKRVYKEAAEEASGVMNTFAAMHECYCELVSLSHRQTIDKWKQVLLNSNKIFHILSDNLNSWSQMMESVMGNMHRVGIRGSSAVSRVHRRVLDTQKDYAAKKESLLRKKEKTYAELCRNSGTKDMLSEWSSKEQAIEELLPVESQHLEEELKWLGYLYTNYTIEFNKHICRQSQLIGKAIDQLRKGWHNTNQSVSKLVAEIGQQITNSILGNDSA